MVLLLACSHCVLLMSNSDALAVHRPGVTSGCPEFHAVDVTVVLEVHWRYQRSAML